MAIFCGFIKKHLLGDQSCMHKEREQFTNRWNEQVNKESTEELMN